MLKTFWIVLLIWCVLRVGDLLAPQRGQVLGADTIYYFGVVGWTVAALLLASIVVRASLVAAPRAAGWPLYAVWFAFFGLGALAALFFTPFRISAIGIFASVGGLSNSASQALYLLVKLYPLHPVVPLNALASVLAGGTPDTLSLSRHLMESSELLRTYLVCGVVVAACLATGMAGSRLAKVVLFAVVAGAGATYFFAVQEFDPTVRQQNLLLLTTYTPLPVFLTGLAVYGVLRELAKRRLVALPTKNLADDASSANKGESTEEETMDDQSGDGQSQLNATSDRSGSPTAWVRDVLLPPGRGALMLATYLMLPILGDLHNQFTLEHQRREMLAELQSKPTGAASGSRPIENAEFGTPMRVTAVTLNVRLGPSPSFPVVSQMRRGATVRVIERQGDWARIGEDQWVSVRYLTSP